MNTNYKSLMAVLAAGLLAAATLEPGLSILRK